MGRAYKLGLVFCDETFGPESNWQQRYDGRFLIETQLRMRAANIACQDHWTLGQPQRARAACGVSINCTISLHLATRTFDSAVIIDALKSRH